MVRAGALEQDSSGEEELRGVGAATEKSAELLSVSVQPPAARITAVVFEGAAVGEVSLQLTPLPKPTRSTTEPAVQEVSAVWEETNATLPAVALKASVPVASGAGRDVVPPAPCDSCTR